MGVYSETKENQSNNLCRHHLSWNLELLNVNFDQISCSAVNSTPDSTQGNKEKQEATILADKVNLFLLFFFSLYPFFSLFVLGRMGALLS